MYYNNNYKTNFYGSRNARPVLNGNYTRPYKKRSGCSRKSATKNGEAKDIIHGWKYTKRTGLISFVATVAKDKFQTQKDKETYTTMVAKVQSAFGERLYFVFWNKRKGILFFPDIKMVASPSANYWSYIKP